MEEPPQFLRHPPNYIVLNILHPPEKIIVANHSPARSFF